MFHEHLQTSKVSFGFMLTLGQRFGSAFILLGPHSPGSSFPERES